MGKARNRKIIDEVGFYIDEIQMLKKEHAAEMAEKNELYQQVLSENVRLIKDNHAMAAEKSAMYQKALEDNMKLAEEVRKLKTWDYLKNAIIVIMLIVCSLAIYAGLTQNNQSQVQTIENGEYRLHQEQEGK